MLLINYNEATTMHHMEHDTITGQINVTALEILEDNKQGLRKSELLKLTLEADPRYDYYTVLACIQKLLEHFPDHVYKPSRGKFRLTRYEDAFYSVAHR
jgi:hypothetical protein